MMKVESVKPLHGEVVSFAEYENKFIRYSATCWMESYGDSDEHCYAIEEELEAAYQEYKKNVA